MFRVSVLRFIGCNRPTLSRRPRHWNRSRQPMRSTRYRKHCRLSNLGLIPCCSTVTVNDGIVWLGEFHLHGDGISASPGNNTENIIFDFSSTFLALVYGVFLTSSRFNACGRIRSSCGSAFNVHPSFCCKCSPTASSDIISSQQREQRKAEYEPV
jgi:hypothetical protein